MRSQPRFLLMTLNWMLFSLIMYAMLKVKFVSESVLGYSLHSL